MYEETKQKVDELARKLGVKALAEGEKGWGVLIRGASGKDYELTDIIAAFLIKMENNHARR